jgi:hypothetical protein
MSPSYRHWRPAVAMSAAAPLSGSLHPSPNDPTSIREVLHKDQFNANWIGGDTSWIVVITRLAIVRHGSPVTASDYRATGARNRTVTSSNLNGDKGEFRRELLTRVDKAQKNDLVSRWICGGGHEPTLVLSPREP